MNPIDYHHKQSRRIDKSGFLSAYRCIWSLIETVTQRQAKCLLSRGFCERENGRMYRPAGIDLAAYDLKQLKIMRGLKVTPITDAQWVRSMAPTKTQKEHAITI